MEKNIYIDCIKCDAVNTVEIQMKKVTKTGSGLLIKPCTSCNKQSSLKEITDHMQSKLNNTN